MAEDKQLRSDVREVRTWHSQMPEDWQTRSLSYAIKGIHSGTSVNGEDRSPLDGEPTVLTLSCIRSGTFDPKEAKVVVEADRGKVSVPVRGSTILMSRKNTRDLVGASAYVGRDYPNVYLPDLLWQLVVDCDTTCPRWLGCLLASTQARHRIAATAAGTSGSMKGITKSAILALDFAFPPLPEQKAIVEVLGAAEASVRAADTLIRKKVARKRAVAEELLTGRRRLPGFNDPWRNLSLGRYFQPKDERSPTKSPMILSCSKIYGILPQNQRFSKQLASVNNEHYKHIVSGDLVYDPMLLWDASISFSDYEGIVSPAYETFTWIGEGIGDRRFFRGLFRSIIMRQVYKRISQGTNARRRKAPASDFLRETLQFPTKQEQAAIADALDAFATELALLQHQRAALDAQRKALMQKLLTGEVRLKEFRI